MIEYGTPYQDIAIHLEWTTRGGKTTPHIPKIHMVTHAVGDVFLQHFQGN